MVKEILWKDMIQKMENNYSLFMKELNNPSDSDKMINFLVGN